MHDPKFEKEVQQKMEELTFIPSETVWENVEKEIGKDKKRRIPVFWLFLLAGITLAGGYYALFYKNGAPPVISPTLSQDMPASPSRSVQKPGETPFPSSASSTSPATAGATTARATTLRVTAAGVTTAGAGKNDPAKKDIGPVNAAQSKASKNINDRKSAGKNDQKTSAGESVTGLSNEATPPASKENTAIKNTAMGNTAGAAKESTTKDNTPKDNSAKESTAKESTTKESTTKESTTKESTAKENTAKKSIITPDKQVAGRNKIKDIHHWKIGLTGGTGISAIDRSLFRRSSTAELSTFASTFAAYPPGWQTRPSRIGQDVSFTAGVFALRPVSRKISFSIGLTYHYYSTTVQTGTGLATVPGPAPGLYNSYSLFLPASLTVNGLAAGGSVNSKNDEGVYKEQYHLLELPVSVQWQLTPIRKMPVYWETGLSISRLIGTNALYYDGPLASYYKEDNALFRKTQVSVSTAFMLGLPVAGHRLQLGPQIQYGLTGLQKDNAGDAQHLFFAGMKLAFIMGK